MASNSKEKDQDVDGESNPLLVSQPVAKLVISMRNNSAIKFNLENGLQARADELIKLIMEEEELPPEAREIFSLWFVSPILSLRLKDRHQPFHICHKWDQLCAQYTDAKLSEISKTEPVLMFQRDVFYPKDKESQCTNEKVLSLLYHEAKDRVKSQQYVLYTEDYHSLAALQAFIQMGSSGNETHMLEKLYPENMYTKERFPFFHRSNSRECEELFTAEYSKVSSECAHISKCELYRKYLEVCWSYPFYGSAFFSGLVETHTSRLKKFILPSMNTKVWVAINTECVTIINRDHCEILLTIPFMKLSWEFQDMDLKEGFESPCLFLQFLVDKSNSNTNGTDEDDEEQVTKLLKVYSWEARLMDALINTCVQRRRNQQYQSPSTDPDPFDFGSKIVNKLEVLCLSTYSKEGESMD